MKGFHKSKGKKKITLGNLPILFRFGFNLKAPVEKDVEAGVVPSLFGA